MSTYKVAVVVPVYKKEINKLEEISLQRLIHILGTKYNIIFICPEKLDTTLYEHKLHQANVNKYSIERFSDKYFQDIRGYNQLMLSSDFYKQFLNYKYIFIYQLDCYVFKDELEYWCNKGYDYIGAPFLDYKYYNLSKFQKGNFLIKQFINRIMGSEITGDSIIYKVGNGGFSLRKTKKIYNVLNNISEERKEKYMSKLSSDIRNEDTFFAYEVNRYYNRLRIPNYRIASKFALEWNPKIGMGINKGKLPFGCHAWNKKIDFWREYIEI